MKRYGVLIILGITFLALLYFVHIHKIPKHQPKQRAVVYGKIYQCISPICDSLRNELAKNNKQAEVSIFHATEKDAVKLIVDLPVAGEKSPLRISLTSDPDKKLPCYVRTGILCVQYYKKDVLFKEDDNAIQEFVGAISKWSGSKSDWDKYTSDM